MTVWINPIAEESDSTIQSDGRIVNTYKRTYQYRTDAPVRPTESDIIADIGIVPGSPYDNDVTATANKVTIGPGPVMTRPPYLCYHVGITWATNSPNPAENSTDPTTRRTLWSIKANVEPTNVIKDKNGKLIVNAAGQPFEGGVPTNIRYGVAVARRNVDATAYDKSTVMAHSGKVNSVKFLGGDPGTVQVDIEAEERFEGSSHFWAETYTFSYRKYGWQPKPANAGFFKLVDHGFANMVVEPIYIGDLSDPPTNDRTKVQEPEPLYDADGDGYIKGSVVPYHRRPDDCTFVTVDFYDTMDFNSFGL